MNAETVLHISVADFLRRVVPPSVPWTTFPAGGGGKERGSLLKAMGFKPGWPDIILVKPGSERGPGIEAGGRLYGIELKAPKGLKGQRGGKLSDDQKQVHPELIAAGAEVAVCRSLDDVELQLLAWGFELRATIFPRTDRRAA